MKSNSHWYIVPSLAIVVAGATLLSTGCSEKPQTSGSSTDGKSQSETTQLQNSAGDSSKTNDTESATNATTSKTSTSATASLPVETKMIRADLDGYIARFKDQTGWTYGERTPGELSGTWRTVDGNRFPIVFDVDGVPGTFSEDFVGTMTVGLYAISSTGKIVTVSSAKGASLGSHFQLTEETITGPRGPDPVVEWQRVK